MSRKISIEELTRVEGHGGIEVIFEGNQIKDVKMNIFEGPRFFEAFIEGVYYDKIPDITRRICAICTASHSLASIRAIENAFDVKVTEQTRVLRDLLIHGEMVESHALHVFMLALPDFLGFHDAVRMTEKFPEEVKAALQLKKAGNLVHNVLSGREVHGMNDRVGGFSKAPTEKELLEIKQLMESTKGTAMLAVKLFAEIDTPRYSESENTLMALDPGDKFGFIGDHVLISTGERRPIQEYRQLTNERTVRYSHAKFSSYNGSSFMVGALPRVLLNKDKLNGTARELFNEHRDLIVQSNSLTNNLAQAIELVHSVERSIEDVEVLLSMGVRQEELADIKVSASNGVGAVEAPRGILYHNYEFDSNGRIAKADVITPTAQSAANMEKDFRVTAKNLINEPDEKIRQALEIVARAYDPCISCSVHLVRVIR
ncbi:MAG: Ni/Fe hydrogenase subunit alpha [Candidatus Hodarchaeota archaeon]